MTTHTTEPTTPHTRGASPTGRPIYADTVEELADGVDLYTRRLKVARHRKARERHA